MENWTEREPATAAVAVTTTDPYSLTSVAVPVNAAPDPSAVVDELFGSANPTSSGIKVIFSSARFCRVPDGRRQKGNRASDAAAAAPHPPRARAQMIAHPSPVALCKVREVPTLEALTDDTALPLTVIVSEPLVATVTGLAAVVPLLHTTVTVLMPPRIEEMSGSVIVMPPAVQ